VPSGLRLWLNRWTLYRKLVGRLPYEPGVFNVARRLVKRGSIALDIGAHVGRFTIELADLVGPEGHVYAIEAHPDNAAVISARLKALHIDDRVTVIAKAATDGVSPSIQLFAGRHGSSSEWNVVGTTVNRRPAVASRIVEAASIDALLPANLVVDFAKIDVEGAEAITLTGMSQLLARCHPALIVEVHPNGDWLSVRDTLERAGYSILGLDGRSANPAGAANTTEHIVAVARAGS